MGVCKIVLATCAFATVFLGATPATAGDAQCTVTVEACGALEQPLAPLTKITEGICVTADVASVGTKPQGLHYKAVVWVGVGVTADTLVFGKGEAKTGVTITCTWKLGKPKPADQIASIKASLPQLLKDEKILKAFPGVKKIDVSKLKSMTLASPSCAAELMKLGK